MFYDIYSKLCKNKGLSPSKVALEMGINKGTVSVWKNKGTTPQRDILQKIADYFNISIDELLGNEKKPILKDEDGLTKKDKKDIAKRLEQMLGEMSDGNDALMFDGEPLDEETMELLRASLENTLKMSKILAKKKFTPKKYRKED